MPVSYNNFIKKPNQQIEYTTDLIKEIELCRNDFYYFCKYVQVKHPDLGRIPYVPREYQRDLLDKILNNRMIIGLWARQLGKTLSVSVYILWYALFNKEKTIGIVSNKQTSAIKILTEIKKMYETLPIWLKPGVNLYNQTSIEFDNNTLIIVSATTEDPFRGFTLNCIFVDEISFIGKNIAEAFWSSNFPALSASLTSKVIVISTPNGRNNLFHKLYIGAIKNENGFVSSTYDWKVIVDRDEEWKQYQINVLGKTKFCQEHENNFLGSANTLIETEMLKELENNDNEEYTLQVNNKLKIYETPQEHFEYVIGVDVGKGTGEHYSTMQILKIINYNPVKFEQVGVFQDNYTDVYTFSQIVYQTAIYFNEAYLMVENNIGDTVISQLWWEYEYENLINEGSKSTQLGVRATTKTKPRAVLIMKKLIEDKNLLLKDKNTIKELTGFIEDNGKYYGKDITDDLISALYWACYFIEFDILEDKEIKMGINTEDMCWGILGEQPEEDMSWVGEL